MAEHVTAELVTVEEAPEITERFAITGFLAGYTSATRRAYTTDLRVFHEWCTDRQLRLLEVQRSHIELFARWLEHEGRMRSTIARRLSTLSGFYRYCHTEGLIATNPACTSRAPSSLRSSPRVRDS